jgi:hypothetical protein
MVQVVAGGTVAPQVPVPDWAKLPLTVRLIVNAVGWLFRKETVLAALVWPTAKLPNARDVVSVTGGTPNPVRVAVSGLFDRLCAIAREPVFVPVDVGRKTTPIVQLADGAKVPAQVPVPLLANSPVIVIALIVSGEAASGFFTVMFLATLDAPTATVPSERAVGAMEGSAADAHNGKASSNATRLDP